LAGRSLVNQAFRLSYICLAHDLFYCTDGIGCARAGIPALYARTSGFAAWIRDTICTVSARPPKDCPRAAHNKTRRPSPAPKNSPPPPAPATTVDHLNPIPNVQDNAGEGDDSQHGKDKGTPADTVPTTGTDEQTIVPLTNAAPTLPPATTASEDTEARIAGIVTVAAAVILLILSSCCCYHFCTGLMVVRRRRRQQEGYEEIPTTQLEKPSDGLLDR